MGFIYKITNTVNGHMYVGKTTKTIEQRWEEHQRKAKQYPNRYLYDAMNCYGYDKFFIESIEECSDEVLDEREKYWIAQLDTIIPNGYNMTIGGDGGNTWNKNPDKELTSMKLIVANRGKKRNEEFCNNLSKKLKGRFWSSEKSKQAAESRKTNIAKERGYSSWEERQEYIEFCKNLFKNDKTHRHSLETKIRLSEYFKGKTYEERYGEEHAQDRKQNLRSKWLGEHNPNYIFVDKDVLLNKIINHDKVDDIANYFHTTPQTIYNKCQEYFGTRKTSEVRKKYEK